MMRGRRLRRSQRSRRSLEDFEATAGAVQRLAVLLGAGVAPWSAWSYVDADIGREPHSVAAVLASRSLPWKAVAAMWIVATEAGTPIAPVLKSFATSLRSLAQAQRDIATALSGPAATARLVIALPALGLLAGTALGFDSIRVLFTTPAGITCGIVGIALLGLGMLWNRRLVASAQPRDVTAGLRSELLSVALAGGASIDRATASVARALESAGLGSSAGSPLGSRASERAVEEVLELSRAAGVPASELLRSHAEEERRAAAANAVQRASVLAVRLVIPLGVCILPAFMLVGVAPLLIAVISSTTANL